MAAELPYPIAVVPRNKTVQRLNPRELEAGDAGLGGLDAGEPPVAVATFDLVEAEARLPARRQEDALPRQGAAARAAHQGGDHRLRPLVRLSRREREPADRRTSARSTTGRRTSWSRSTSRPSATCAASCCPASSRPGHDQEPEDQVRVLRHAAAGEQGSARGRAQDHRASPPGSSTPAARRSVVRQGHSWRMPDMAINNALQGHHDRSRRHPRPARLAAARTLSLELALRRALRLAAARRRPRGRAGRRAGSAVGGVRCSPTRPPNPAPPPRRCC